MQIFRFVFFASLREMSSSLRSNDFSTLPRPLEPKTNPHQQQQSHDGDDQQLVFLKTRLHVRFNLSHGIGLGEKNCGEEGSAKDSPPFFSCAPGSVRL